MSGYVLDLSLRQKHTHLSAITTSYEGTGAEPQSFPKPFAGAFGVTLLEALMGELYLRIFVSNQRPVRLIGLFTSPDNA